MRETVSERTVCKFLEITTKTVQNWRKHGTTDRRKGSSRHVEHRLSEAERQAFYDAANSTEYADRTPEQIVANLAEKGIYYGSVSTLYRILRERSALHHRKESKKPVARIQPLPVEITGPNQVWTWDITWLKTDVAGLFKYGYNIIDLYDRTLVGWTVEDSESDEHARRLFQRIIRDMGVAPKIIHADNGGPMKGASLGAFLDWLCISRSYSRPRCSNDNAFIESWHKTLKYTVGYPKFFTSLEHARTWYADFVNWYNNFHLHSALGYVTPIQMRTGKAQAIFEIRNKTLQEAKAKNPLRWRTDRVRCYSAKPVSITCRILKKAA